MKKFTPGDLQRLKNQVETIQSILEPGAPGAALFTEIQEVLSSHSELVERYSRTRTKKNALGRQLNHVNDRLREVKKANKTLTDKAHGRQAVDIETIEPTATLTTGDTRVRIEADPTGRCCRGS